MQWSKHQIEPQCHLDNDHSNQISSRGTAFIGNRPTMYKIKLSNTQQSKHKNMYIQLSDMASRGIVVGTITFDSGIIVRAINAGWVNGSSGAWFPTCVPLVWCWDSPLFKYRIQNSHCNQIQNQLVRLGSHQTLPNMRLQWLTMTLLDTILLQNQLFRSVKINYLWVWMNKPFISFDVTSCQFILKAIIY